MNQDEYAAATAATTSSAVLPQPVKAMTAFHIWRKDNEHHYRAANPWVGGTELSALIALGWRRLDATTKKVLASPPPASPSFLFLLSHGRRAMRSRPKLTGTVSTGSGRTTTLASRG